MCVCLSVSIVFSLVFRISVQSLSGSPKTMIKTFKSDCRNILALKDQRVGILPFELNFISYQLEHH